MKTKQDKPGRPQLDAPKGLPSRLRSAREACGLTMYDVAKKLKVTYATADRWERGHQEPNLAKVKRLAKLLGVQWVWLLSGEGAVTSEGNPDG